MKVYVTVVVLVAFNRVIFREVFAKTELPEDEYFAEYVTGLVKNYTNYDLTPADLEELFGPNKYVTFNAARPDNTEPYTVQLLRTYVIDTSGES